MSTDYQKIKENKYGCWFYDGVFYKDKIDALKKTTNTYPLKRTFFYYHDPLWMNYNLSTLGKRPLPLLYKERAQQLRDRYDHLVLHYSGGSDSHNILQTFIDNNIKLDEITVRWPKALTDGKFYTPNKNDISASNTASEWDYVIKPELQKLQQTHPKIKINIYDYTEKITTSSHNVDILENKLLNLNSCRGALISLAMRMDNDYDRRLTTSGSENVGHIFGVEKPTLFCRNNKLYFYFTDAPFEIMLMNDALKENRVESFYWAPDYPELTIEQAYQVGLHFKNNPDKLYLLNNDTKTISDINAHYTLQQAVIKQIIYDTWDYTKFQADKPNIDRSDTYFWLHHSSELNSLQQSHHRLMNNITSSLREETLINTDKTPLFKPYRSRLFYLMDL